MAGKRSGDSRGPSVAVSAERMIPETDNKRINKTVGNLKRHSITSQCIMRQLNNLFCQHISITARLK